MAYIPKNFNSEQKQKLGQVIADGVRVLDEVKSLNEGLRETVKAVADEYEIKASILTRAIKTAYDRNFDDQSDDVQLLDEILTATKNK